MKIPETTLLEHAPAVWDGFGFFMDHVDRVVKFYFFDDITRVHGELPGDPNIPADRTAYHVLLTCTRKNRVHIELPFTSNFLDAFVYAKRVAEAGFRGIMIKENKFSLALAEASLKETMMFHASEYGFVLEDEKGIDMFYAGRKKEEKIK